MNLKHASIGAVALAGIGLGLLSTPALSAVATCDTANFTTSTACVAGLTGGSGGNVTADVMNSNTAFGQSTWKAVEKMDLPDVSNSVFTLDVTSGGAGDAKAGSWSLAPSFNFEAGKVYAFAIKGSTTNAVYLLDTAFTSGLWNTLDIDGKGLSNITLFEAAVPLPAAAWLFGSALMGLAGIGYRRKRAQLA